MGLNLRLAAGLHALGGLMTGALVLLGTALSGDEVPLVWLAPLLAVLALIFVVTFPVTAIGLELVRRARQSALRRAMAFAAYALTAGVLGAVLFGRAGAPFPSIAYFAGLAILASTAYLRASPVDHEST